MKIAEHLHKTLGEIRPDIAIPGQMTDMERHLWVLYFESEADRRESKSRRFK